MSKSIQNIPIAILISGTGSNLQAIIDAEHNLNYRVDLVISNRPDTYGIERAKKHGIKTLVIDHCNYSNREEFDEDLLNSIKKNNIEFVILAGFMRILTTNFTNHFLGKMLNVHPSLLPKYPGLNTHQKALDNKDLVHGISIHFVTAELDGGPIIKQASFNIEDNKTALDLQKSVQSLEHIHYPQVVDCLVTKKISLKNNQTLFNEL